MDYTLGTILIAALLGVALTIFGLIVEVRALTRKQNASTAKIALTIRGAGLLIWGLMALLSSGSDGWTPLMMSIFGGFVAVAASVVAFGFDVSLLGKRPKH